MSCAFVQDACKKLPKALRDWQAYEVCRKTIDDFLQLLPLLQQLSTKAMRNRHWMQVSAICTHCFRFSMTLARMTV